MNQSSIIFNESNIYFQDTKLLQSEIGFVNMLDIDTYVKMSFLGTTDELIISGGDIEVFDKNHLVDERFVCYKIQEITNKPLIEAQGMISIDLAYEGLISKNVIKLFVQGFSLVSLIALSVLSAFLPTNIAIILRYITIFGVLMTCLFYMGKIFKVIFKTITSKAVDYDGVSVNYQVKEDMNMINSKNIIDLKKLYSEFNVQQLVFIHGVCYIKQTTTNISFRSSIKSIFTGSSADDKATKKLIGRTVQFFFDLSNFTK